MFKTIFVDYLQKHSISAYKLAKETGISQGLISDYKNGAKKPTIDNLIKIADYFKCSIDFLLGRTGTDEKEIQLINDFRQLNDEGKEDVLDYTNYATTKLKYQKNTDVSKEA